MRVAIVGLGTTLLFFVTIQVSGVASQVQRWFLPKICTHFFSRYDLNGYIIKALK